MPEQLNLLNPEDDVHPAPTAELLSLFLAIFPPPEDAAAIARQADELRERHGLKSERQAVGRLHVSLHNLGNFDGAVPRAHVDAAIAGAASVTCSPMRLVFDRALSFAGSNAFVLRCDAGSDKAIAGLRQRLALALRRVGHAPERPGHPTSPCSTTRATSASTPSSPSHGQPPSSRWC